MSAVDSVKARIEQRPKQAVLITAIVALLVGAIIGLGVGYKVERDRKLSAKSSTTKTTKPLKTTKTTKPGGTATAGAVRHDGTVSAVGAGFITVKTVKGASGKLEVSAATAVDRATKGSRTDVTVGRNVLVRPPGIEVLVLRSGSTQGRAVTSASESSIGLAASNGLPKGTVKTTSSTIFDTVAPATFADVKVGDRVIALSKPGASQPLIVDTLIILPAGSKFAS